MQVRLYAPTEIKILKEQGYLDRIEMPLLDLGCGTGAYAELLSENIPNSHIVAVDANETLLEEFRERLQRGSGKRNIEILQWTAGKDGITDKLSTCRTVVLRLFFQHYTYDPQRLFSELNSALPEGSLVIVIEEDDGFFQIHPECRAWRREVELQTEYAKTTKIVKRFEGRMIPQYAGSAGMKVEYSSVVAHTNVNLGTRELMNHFIKTLELVHITTPQILSEDEMQTLCGELNDYVEQHGDNCFFLYPNVMTIARTQ